MSADFSPLDTSQRNKVLGIIQQLADAGLSDSEIAGYFQQAQGMGQQSLSDYFNQAGTAIGQQFEPQFNQARNTLGANPLLADSGYANRLNRQIMSDLGARLSSDYSGRAADESGRNMDFYRSLVGQRTGLRSNLAQSAYQTMAGLPRKKTAGETAAGIAGQVVGTVAGAALGRGGGGGGGYGSAGGGPSADYYTPGQSAATNDFFGYQPRPYRSPYRAQGDY